MRIAAPSSQYRTARYETIAQPPHPRGGLEQERSKYSRHEMKKTDCFSRLPNEKDPLGVFHLVPKCIGIAILLLVTGSANAQSATPEAPAASAPAPVVQEGFIVRQTADLGGHMVGVSGSGSMYDTLVNIHSGPRVLGETFTLHAVPGTKHPLIDSLTAFSNGFGGDPINYAKLDFSKGKLYEFSGTFRRDRQYFDYDLLANPSVPPITVPYGMTAGVPTAASFQWQQVNQSPVMFNTVRRMTDTNLTILPLSKVTFRLGYSQNIFQGPSLTPGGYDIGKSTLLLQEYQRNSTDDFLAAIDWKPFEQTKLTFEEQVDHYKADSTFTVAPGAFNAQEADGTPVALGGWDATASPYTTASCNTASMGTAYTNATTYTIFTAPSTPGGLPVVNPACDVITKYARSQPTRVIYPTEILRFQSASIKNISTNGDFRYTISNSSLPNYYENLQGLDGTIRSATFTGGASAQRRVVALDYGLSWDVTKTITLSDQVTFSNVHQPGNVNVSVGVTQNTPALTTGNATINYSGPLVAGAAFSVNGNPAGTTLYGYFGQKYITNNATASWDPSSRAQFALTYRYQTHTINRGSPVSPLLLVGIDENGGIFNAAFRPTAKWDMNGTVEILYDNNAFTPMGPRQTKHYRFHTLYKPRIWATVSGTFNDRERHNNTNNTGVTPADGPLQHVDYSRSGSVGLTLDPNEHYSFNMNYAYTDVYISTNACYLNGATATLPGTATVTSSGAASLCPGVFTRGSTTILSSYGPTKDFMDAPTQFASVGVVYLPKKWLRSAAGYDISAVSGNQFFANAQQVNGSLQSAYQTPYVNVAWTVHPGWIWSAEYKYYGYGEGGPSGAPLCTTSTTATAVITPCSSSTFAGVTGLTEPSSGLTAPRNFHANLVTLAMHYEF
jgi:hypothetical protein